MDEELDDYYLYIETLETSKNISWILYTYRAISLLLD